MEKQKKKKNSSGKIFMAMSVLMGIICGVMLSFMTDSMDFGKSSAPNTFAFYIFLLLMMYVAMFIQTIIHEGGHLIFGLLTGYEFSSFRIGSLLWKKEDGKMKLKKYSLPGTGGQCLMRPPALMNGMFPVVLYNLGGVILNLLFAVLFILLGFSVGQKEQPILFFFCMISAFIGVFFALTNGIPMNTGTINNDGKNALSLKKNPKAMRALWIQLEVNHLLSTGTPLRKMKKEWFQPVSEEDMQNHMTAALATLRCNRLMEEQKYAQAKEEMNAIANSENALSGLNKNFLTNDMIFCELLESYEPAVIEQLLTKPQKQFMKSMKHYPSILRTQYALALIYEKNAKKADKIKLQFNKIVSTYPYPVEIEAEEKNMELAANIAKKLTNTED